MKKPSLLLVGYGRFGAFAAGVLKKRFTVHILDRDRRKAPSVGLRRAETRDIRQFETVLLAIPAHRLRTFLERHGRRFRPGAFVADLCAVKSAPMRWLRRELPRSVSFAGLHPLFGPESAAKGIDGLPVVVCRGRTTARCYSRLIAVLRSFGLKPVETTPAIHDRTMAFTLFLTQMLGSALWTHSLGERKLFETPSYVELRKITERAGKNSPELIRELREFVPSCAIVRRRLRSAVERATRPVPRRAVRPSGRRRRESGRD